MVDEENHIVNVMRVIGGQMDLDQIDLQGSKM